MPRTIYSRGKSTVYPSNRRKTSWPYRELNHDSLAVKPAAVTMPATFSWFHTHTHTQCTVHDVISLVRYAKTRELCEHLKILKKLLITLGQILDTEMQVFWDITPCWLVQLIDVSKRRLSNHHLTQSDVPWNLNLQQNRCNKLKSHICSRHAATTTILWCENFGCGRDVSGLLRGVRLIKFTDVSRHLVGSIIWFPYHHSSSNPEDGTDKTARNVGKF